MSSLTVYHESNPEQPLKLLTHAEDIAYALGELGVRFQRWAANAPIVPGASQEEVIAAYQHEIRRLQEEEGYVTVDVVSLTADHPQKDELRAKFLDEHRHGEDEGTTDGQRFTVDLSQKYLGRCDKNCPSYRGKKRWQSNACARPC